MQCVMYLKGKKIVIYVHWVHDLCYCLFLEVFSKAPVLIGVTLGK